jgi:TatD DNase family protein
MTYIDTHAHLDQQEFDDDRRGVIARARRAGVEHIQCVGVTAASSESAVELAQSHPEIFAAVGIHPNSAAESQGDDWDRVLALLARPRVVAIGETGLDRHWDFTPWEQQKEYFDRHLRLAQQRDLPVIIHCREAEADVLAMLREAAARGPLRGVIHAFSGDAAMAAECLELGLYVGFAGNVTYSNRKFQPLRAAAAGIPRDRLLLETDSPYLVPHPFRGKRDRNEPSLVLLTAQALADLRGQDLAELAADTTANARELFRLG